MMNRRRVCEAILKLGLRVSALKLYVPSYDDVTNVTIPSPVFTIQNML
jgi:hypothetical protein